MSDVNSFVRIEGRDLKDLLMFLHSFTRVNVPPAEITERDLTVVTINSHLILLTVLTKIYDLVVSIMTRERRRMGVSMRRMVIRRRRMRNMIRRSVVSDSQVLGGDVDVLGTEGTQDWSQRRNNLQII